MQTKLPDKNLRKKFQVKQHNWVLWGEDKMLQSNPMSLTKERWENVKNN